MRGPSSARNRSSSTSLISSFRAFLSPSIDMRFRRLRLGNLLFVLEAISEHLLIDFRLAIACAKSRCHRDLEGVCARSSGKFVRKCDIRDITLTTLGSRLGPC